MAWQRRRACKVDWTFQTEEREGSFCKGSESRQCVFLLGSYQEVSFVSVQGLEMFILPVSPAAAFIFAIPCLVFVFKQILNSL